MGRYSLPEQLDEQVETVYEREGFATKAEFVRAAVREKMDDYDIPKISKMSEFRERTHNSNSGIVFGVQPFTDDPITCDIFNTLSNNLLEISDKRSSSMASHRLEQYIEQDDTEVIIINEASEDQTTYHELVTRHGGETVQAEELSSVPLWENQSPTSGEQYFDFTDMEILVNSIEDTSVSGEGLSEDIIDILNEFDSEEKRQEAFLRRADSDEGPHSHIKKTLASERSLEQNLSTDSPIQIEIPTSEQGLFWCKVIGVASAVARKSMNPVVIHMEPKLLAGVHQEQLARSLRYARHFGISYQLSIPSLVGVSTAEEIVDLCSVVTVTKGESDIGTCLKRNLSLGDAATNHLKTVAVQPEGGIIQIQGTGGSIPICLNSQVGGGESTSTDSPVAR